MKNFIAGLRYGNWLTRLYLISIPILISAGIGLIVYSFVANSMWMFLVGTALGIGGIALAQGFAVEVSGELVKEPEEYLDEELPPEELSERNEMPEETEPQEEFAEESEETPTKKKRKEKKKRNTREPKQKREPKEKRQRKRKQKQEPDELADTEVPEESEQNNLEEDAKQEKKEEKEQKEPKGKPEDALVGYDEQKLQHVFYKFKVRKDHRPIMIDSWEEKEVSQCPAYIWVHRGQLHMLVMESSAREITVPVAKVSTMKYIRGKICKAKKEYLQFRKESALAIVFAPFLPTYHEGMKNGKSVVYKNLFELGSGLRITNTSVKTIMDMIAPEFQVDDIIMRDVRYNDFFKEIYKAGILFRNKVLTTKEYRDLISDTLHKLVKTGVSEKEYENTLQSLYQHKLITEEYISFYMQYWKRVQIENKYVNKKRRKDVTWKL